MITTMVDDAMGTRVGKGVGAGTLRHWVRPVHLRVMRRPTAANIEDETRQHTVLSGFSSGDGGAMVVPVATKDGGSSDGGGSSTVCRTSLVPCCIARTTGYSPDCQPSIRLEEDLQTQCGETYAYTVRPRVVLFQRIW